MYSETIDHFAGVAEKKAAVLKKAPTSFFIGSMMAGAYVGLGIILIFTLGSFVDPSIRKLVMGGTFGIALTLVVFAGSELFTGLTMFMTLGWLRGKTGVRDLTGTWAMSWIGNLVGAAGLALIYYAGNGALLGAGSDLLNGVASAKMNKPALDLFALGILCNWLVCLALWMSARTQSDAAKCIIIFWCLFAFIASGYEHSIANMTIFSVALLTNHPETVSLAGMAHNLLWVTLGNALAGAMFMGFGYWRATPQNAQGI
jgi:nitrite transporter